MTGRAAALALALATGCDDLAADASDGAPIAVEVADGAVRLEVRDDDGTTHAGVIELMSPITVLDVGVGVAVDRRPRELRLLAGGVPRARVTTDVLELHPCTAPTCLVGRGGAEAPYAMLVGADALDGLTPRLDVGAATLALLPDVAGSDEARARTCDGVFSGPLRGGGTLLVGGAELAFAGRRITLAGCLDPRPDPAVPVSERGTSVVLVQSTTVGPTLLAAAAYERYRIAQGLLPPGLAALPRATAWLPSGSVEGGLATLPALALAGDAENARGGCGEVYASHYLLPQACSPDDDPACPCVTGEACLAPAVVELAPAAGLEVIVVPDDDPTIQALRSELRPSEAEVDGILGTDALRGVQLDVDYPNNRLLWRCTDAAACAVRPHLASDEARPDLAACLPG